MNPAVLIVPSRLQTRAGRPAVRLKQRPAGQKRWLIVALALTMFMTGCVTLHPTATTPPAAQTGGGHYGGPAVDRVWRGLADNLAGQGFTDRQIREFLNSPELRYTHSPMETKLRELYGIFYQSGLTRAVQEKLYQLGYDVLIDGRFGPGTGKAVGAFQADEGLSRTGAVSVSLSAALDQAMKRRRGSLRPLSGYSPPPAAKPSRSATHTRFTQASALPQIGGYYREDYDLFRRMTRQYGVPGEVAAAIMWVETSYGHYFGRNRAASMLASMAAACDFTVIEPAVADLAGNDQARAWLRQTADQRGRWALNELAALLRYSYQNRLDPHSLPGSIYGAIGYGQFMPSNAAKFGADGDGDGRVDLFNKADAIFSVGRYLREHGWRGDMSGEEKRREAIMAYNKSGVYVNTVLYVADWLAANVR